MLARLGRIIRGTLFVIAVMLWLLVLIALMAAGDDVPGIVFGLVMVGLMASGWALKQALMQMARRSDDGSH